MELRAQTLVEQFVELLMGATTLAEAALLLEEQNLWARPWIAYHRVGTKDVSFRCVVVQDTAGFESWLRRERGHLVEAYEAADTVVRLNGGARWAVQV